MMLTTHFITGLLIGSISGNYAAAIGGSIIIDVDHFISIIKQQRHHFDPKKIISLLLSSEDPQGDQRNILHNVISVIPLSLIVSILFGPYSGLIFGISHMSHLLLDSLDKSPYFPLYPNKKIKFKGFINYNSTGEHILSLTILIVYLLYSRHVS
jgi:hypothetical protein